VGDGPEERAPLAHDPRHALKTTQMPYVHVGRKRQQTPIAAILAGGEELPPSAQRMRFRIVGFKPQIPNSGYWFSGLVHPRLLILRAT
jgi:hypothetical protein